MARVFGYILALLIVSTSVSAIPVEPRQLGGIGCNVARLRTVAGLRQTTKAVQKLSGAGDAATADAATSADAGLQQASDGIKTIAGALLTGQDAPADARDEVAAGLTAAQEALAGITATDETTTDMLADAQQKLEKTISAGQDVVAKCGGGGAAAPAPAAAEAANVADTADDVAADTADADVAAVNANEVANTAVGNTKTATGTKKTALTLGRRQIGGIACNVARFQTVGRLAAASAAVRNIKSSAAGDTAATAAVTEAGTALNSAKAGIGKIAASLVALQKAPAAARDQVEAGLNDAMTSLASVESTDPAVSDAVASAMDKVASTLEAGNRVVSSC